MSAYFVSKATIDLLVSAAIELKVYATVGTNFGDGGQVTAARADAIGKMLWQANADSLVACYGDRAEDYSAEIEGYRWTEYRDIKPAAIVGCARCFDYQACETENYLGSPAHRFAMDLQAAVAKRLAGDGPWGVDERADGSEYDIAKYARLVSRPVRLPVRAPAPVAPVAPASNVVALRPAPAPAPKAARKAAAPKAATPAPIKPAGFDNFRARLQARMSEAKPARRI